MKYRFVVEVEGDSVAGYENWIFARSPELVRAYYDPLKQCFLMLTHYLRSDVSIVLFPLASEPNEGMILRGIYGCSPYNLPSEFGNIILANKKFVEDLLPKDDSLVVSFKEFGSVLDFSKFKSDWRKEEFLCVGAHFGTPQPEESGVIKGAVSYEQSNTS